MGRRSTKTTKTGKFMNPTDQWSECCNNHDDSFTACSVGSGHAIVACAYDLFSG